MDKNKAITDDYKDYIQKLSPKETQYLGPILYFENGTEQHAELSQTLAEKMVGITFLFMTKTIKG